MTAHSSQFSEKERCNGKEFYYHSFNGLFIQFEKQYFKIYSYDKLNLKSDRTRFRTENSLSTES